MGFARPDGRGPEELRPVNIVREFNKWAEGSVLYQAGDTKVICTATVEDRVPSFLRGTGSGWVTAEYSMLPRATETRSVREAARGRLGGRTYEIQRLVGRALRSIVDLRSLGERTIWLDCDVIQADGGTRTASITGAFVALVDALYRMAGQENWEVFPVGDFVAAVSAGVVDGCSLLDLCYVEDSQADVDMNFVMTGSGRFIEVQGTAESSPFGRDQLDRLLFLAEQGIRQLVDVQKSVLPETAVQAIMRAQSMQTSEERN